MDTEENVKYEPISTGGGGGTNSLTEKKRNTNMDLVRVFAVFSVFSMHFFIHSGFYERELGGIGGYFTMAMKTFFTICVPLFIILSGFLMNKKKLSKRYYKGIIKTIAVYVIVNIICVVFIDKYFGREIDIWRCVKSVFNYGGILYSWYIEMYIGLFLIIPFLNLVYHSLKSKKEKLALIFSFIAVTSLPTIINYEYKVFPDYWESLYPVTYYFIGVFLSEFEINIKKRYILIVLLICVLLFTGFNCYRELGDGYNYDKEIYCKWRGVENLIDSVLVFMFIQKINLERLPYTIKIILKKLSELTLGAYLLSYIFDTIFYGILNDTIVLFYDRAPYYLIVVPMVFVCSMAGSFVINSIIKIFKAIIKKSGKLKQVN